MYGSRQLHKTRARPTCPIAASSPMRGKPTRCWGSSPPGIRRERAGWSTADLDLMEIDEAFAAQALAKHKQMGWNTSTVN
jgi:hypothetical protein